MATFPANSKVAGISTGLTTDLNSVYGLLQTILGPVVLPSGDTTGATDAAAIAAAIAAYGIAYLVAGTYYVKAGVVTLGLNQYIWGAGKSATIVRVVDGSSFLNGFNIANSGSYSTTENAGIGHMTVDGTGTTQSDGIMAGDIVGISLPELNITNFAHGTGLFLNNRTFFTEQLRGSLFIANCAQAVAMEQNGGTDSFDRPDLSLWLNMLDTQIGLLMGTSGGDVVIGEGRVSIWGNFNLGPTGGGTVISFVNGSNITGCHLDIGVETDGSGTAPTTMQFAGSGAGIKQCYGSMYFGGAGFGASNNSSNVQFLGPVSGDTSLPHTTSYNT